MFAVTDIYELPLIPAEGETVLAYIERCERAAGIPWTLARTTDWQIALTAARVPYTKALGLDWWACLQRAASLLPLPQVLPAVVIQASGAEVRR